MEARLVKNIAEMEAGLTKKSLTESWIFYKINNIFCAELFAPNCCVELSNAELSAPNCPDTSYGLLKFYDFHCKITMFTDTSDEMMLPELGAGFV